MAFGQKKHLKVASRAIGSARLDLLKNWEESFQNRLGVDFSLRNPAKAASPSHELTAL